MDSQYSVPLTPIEAKIITALQQEDHAQREANLPIEARTRNISAATGPFLWQMVVGHKPRTILEIGSSTGLSTMWLASAASRIGARLLGTEVIVERAAQNNAQLRRAGLDGTARVADSDHRNVDDVKSTAWEFVFLDAEKDDYLAHLQAIEPYLAPGAVILTDNVISHDCTELQNYLRGSAKYSTITIPLDRGIEYSVLLPQ
ncbi:MAG TPA: class I SAM-dependent methyltransferase [Thermomicrobiales bacterium]|nr:class I SAM-dependent methyltransferase [Thermomicrobiales bacterium]